jgi:zinc/manganese transport system substrate-binding protein
MKKRIAMTLAIAMLVGRMLPGPLASAQDEPLPVVATFSILADLVANVGGDAVEVDTLVGANVDAHTFEPSPEQVVALTNATLIFENGLGFEPWLEGMLDAADPEAQVVDVSQGIELRTAGDHDDEAAGHDPDDEHGHDIGDFDPHVWHSVPNVITMVENIEAALSAADPDNAAIYSANAAAYTTELEALDAWIAEQVAAIPEDQRKLVTSHDTFGYFADQYGFEVIGTPLGVSTETSEPSASEIAELIELIEDAGVPAIFTENIQNDNLMEQIAGDAGVTLAPPLYTDALGDEDSEATTYIEMMQYNTRTIVEALTS